MIFFTHSQYYKLSEVNGYIVIIIAKLKCLVLIWTDLKWDKASLTNCCILLDRRKRKRRREEIAKYVEQSFGSTYNNKGLAQLSLCLTKIRKNERTNERKKERRKEVKKWRKNERKKEEGKKVISMFNQYLSNCRIIILRL